MWGEAWSADWLAMTWLLTRGIYHRHRQQVTFPARRWRRSRREGAKYRGSARRAAPLVSFPILRTAHIFDFRAPWFSGDTAQNQRGAVEMSVPVGEMCTLVTALPLAPSHSLGGCNMN